MLKRQIQSYERIVIKVGSALLVDQATGLRRSWLNSLIHDVAGLIKNGSEVLIVSSGAITLGRRELGEAVPADNLKLEESQAAAAVGQISLSRAYSETCGTHGLAVGQILLTLGDTETRRRYLNARGTIDSLLKWNCIPIINENDTVATNEIRYGDNDRLAARVASMMSADLLVLLSDVDGLYSEPPASNPEAKFFETVDSITPEIEAMAGEASSGHSRGGMITKIAAAKIATGAGTTMVIGSGTVPHAIAAIDNGARATWFAPSPTPINDRKKWIAGGLDLNGSITIDPGAIVALEIGKSLLPAGVTQVTGDFSRGDTVEILGPNGHKLGQGLVEYDSVDARQVAGLKSHEIIALLGPSIRTEMIHRDDMVLRG